MEIGEVLTCFFKNIANRAIPQASHHVDHMIMDLEGDRVDSLIGNIDGHSWEKEVRERGTTRKIVGGRRSSKAESFMGKIIKKKLTNQFGQLPFLQARKQRSHKRRCSNIHSNPFREERREESEKIGRPLYI